MREYIDMNSLCNNEIRKELVEKKSLYDIPSIMFDLDFGGDEYGIFRNCPFEVLHSLWDVLIKYAMECFLEYIGNTSKNKKILDVIAMEYSHVLVHQSNRNFPYVTSPKV